MIIGEVTDMHTHELEPLSALVPKPIVVYNLGYVCNRS